MLVLFTLGLGMLIGAQCAGSIEVMFTSGTGDQAVVDWQKLWFVPAIAAAIIMVIFALIFRDDSDDSGDVTESAVAKAAAFEEQP